MTAKKKVCTALLVLVAAIALVAVSIAGTVAFLTSSSAVSNTFTVGNVFIEMFESPVDEDGKYVSGFNQGSRKTADGNSYHLQPGGTYIKDPSIYVQPTSDDCFLFVRARNQIRTIESQAENTPTMAEQMAEYGWVVYDASQDSTLGTVYIFCGEMVNGKNVKLSQGTDEQKALYAKIANVNEKMVAGTTVQDSEKVIPTRIDKHGYVDDHGVAKEQEILLFERFTLATSIDNIQLFGGAKVTLTAFAVQTTGFLGTDGNPDANSAAKAWAAIVNAYPYENGNVQQGTNP